MAGRPDFQVVPDEPAPSPSTSPAEGGHRPPRDRAAEQMLLLALKSLSQRALIAAADLFCLFTVLSAWWLWLQIPEPNVHQLVSMGIYATFILVANVIVRRR